jgi:hypothetical protein
LPDGFTANQTPPTPLPDARPGAPSAEYLYSGNPSYVTASSRRSG